MTEFISLATGLLVPIAVSYLKSAKWPDAAKIGLTLLISLILGILTTWVGGQIDETGTPQPWTWEELLKNFSLVFASATTFYKTLFQGSNFNQDTLEPRGPFTRTTERLDRPPEDVTPPYTRYFDRAGNEVDPLLDLDDVDPDPKPDRVSRIYPKP